MIPAVVHLYLIHKRMMDTEEVHQLPGSTISAPHSQLLLIQILHYFKSSLRTFINFFKSYIGSGILGLPYAFLEGGVLVSFLILLQSHTK